MTSREEFEAWRKTIHPWQRTENREGAELGWQAARATAWHDAPTTPGIWICNEGAEEPYDWLAFAINKQMLDLTPPKGERWFGPIPKDES